MKKKKCLFTMLTGGFLALCMAVAPLTCGFVNVTAYAAPDVGDQGLLSVPEPIDPKSWKLQRDMTWDEYKPNPAIDWKTAEIEPTRNIKGALILVDYPDRTFISSDPKGSEIMGNPVLDPVAKEDLAKFWLDFLNKPQELNHYVTTSEFWKENSYGQWNVDIDAFGPYTLPYNEFEYGLDQSYNDKANSMPAGYGSGTNRTNPLAYDTYAAAVAAGEIDFTKYDFLFILHAGYAESGIWQEAGEMMFLSTDTIDYEFSALARLEKMMASGLTVPQVAIDWAKNQSGRTWAKTRYQPWTSWYAAVAYWSGQSTITAPDTGNRILLSIQGESNGMATFAHEFGHIVEFRDNYNDPYAAIPVRTYAGIWELMSSGSMGGPGGTHTRWQIPAALGGSVPSHMMQRQKLKLGFTSTTNEILDVNVSDLRKGTPVVAEIMARNIPVGSKFGREGYTGLRLSGMVDQKPRITSAQDWESDTFNGANWYNGYSIEVVDRTGYDSFASDHGVLLSKYKTTETAPYTWVIDSHPGDISLPDFTRADGTTAMMSKGDPHQIADATFHAGVSEGVVNEYEDTYNKLKFYVLDKMTSQGQYGDILSYKVAVLSTEAPIADGTLVVEKGNLEPATAGRVAVQNFKITNTGTTTDIVKIKLGGTLGYETAILNNLYAIKAGETITVPVYITVPEPVGFAAASFTLKELDVVDLTLTATSETGAAKTSAATAEDVANNSTINKLLVKANKTIVTKSDFFDVNVAFTEKVTSNTAILIFKFDDEKFEYRGLYLANGVTELNTVVDGGTLKLTVMVDDYNTKNYGSVRFSANDNLDLTNKANEIVVNASLVVKDGDKKTIEEASGSTIMRTGLIGDTNEDGKVDLIDLSNMIDWFGFDKKTPDWEDKYAFFDFNGNGKIDIADITNVALLIK